MTAGGQGHGPHGRMAGSIRLSSKQASSVGLEVKVGPGMGGDPCPDGSRGGRDRRVLFGDGGPPVMYGKSAGRCTQWDPLVESKIGPAPAA